MSARIVSPAAVTSPNLLLARDGTPLFFRDWGQGKPVVFLHSWAFNADMWQYQMVDLAGRGLRCVAYDRRGHGRSGQPDRGYDYDTLADDLASLLEALDLREVTLVGHSMGGCEVVRYLARHGSARIARAVLAAPMTPFMMKTADNPDGVEREAIEATLRQYACDFTKWADDNTPPFFTPETSPGITRWLLDMLLDTPLKVAIDCQRLTLCTDLRADLRAIDVPVLILHGDADASAPIDLTGRRTAALIRNAELELYEGAPHGLFVTHRERFNEDLHRFITA